MNTSSITATFRWTPEKLIMAQRYHFRHTCRPIFLFLINLICAIIGIAGVTILYFDGFAFFPAALILVSLYWFFIRQFERRWFTARMFKKRPDNNVELNWTFSESGIETSSNLAESKFSWAAIAKIVATPEGLMLYPTPEIFHWLPSCAFASLSDMDVVVAMAKQNKVKWHKVA